MREPGLDELTHLHPAARPLALLPAAQRIGHVRADRWIGYPRALAVIDRLETLLAWPDRGRMPNMLLVGPTNNGKSMIVEKFHRARRPISFADREQIPVLCVQMPPEPSVSRFYVAVLAAVGAPIRPHRRIHDLEQLALGVLRAAEVQMLVIDELHNLLAGRDAVRRAFLNVLRYLGNELRIPIVGVGTREAYLAIRTDAQLENRFEPTILPLWGNDSDMRSLLASFTASFPLRKPSFLTSEEMAGYLLARSEGTIGELSMLLNAAAVAAIEKGAEAITPEILAVADYTGPSRRRRQFEHDLA